MSIALVEGVGVPAPPLPFRVVVFRHRSDYTPYRPAPNSEGSYRGGATYEYILTHWESDNWRRVLGHEYTHMVLSHASASMPRWLEEGLCELYSTVSVRNGKVTLGEPIANHVAVLRSNLPWLSADDLAAVGRDPREDVENGNVPMLYPEGWALVHMLSFDSRWSGGMRPFLTFLAEGRRPEVAFRDAFRRSLEEAIRDARVYVAGPLRTARFDVPLPAKARVTPEPLNETQAIEFRGTLDLDLKRDDAAAEWYARLEHSAAGLPDGQAALGLRAAGQRRFDEALQHFRKAIALLENAKASREQGFIYLEYAVLLRDHETTDPAQVTELLGRAVTVNPDLAEAHFLLGVRLSREKTTPEALQHLERAARILPRQSHFWHALGMAYRESGRHQDAEAAAWRALDTAQAGFEREAAQSLLDLVRQTPEAAPVAPGGPATVMRPAAAKPKFSGTLENIDCLGRSARIQVVHGGDRRLFSVSDPGEVLLRNASSVTFEFKCGRQASVPVTVEYLERSNPGLGTTGEVVSLDFGGVRQ